MSSDRLSRRRCGNKMPKGVGRKTNSTGEPVLKSCVKDTEREDLYLAFAQAAMNEKWERDYGESSKGE